MEKMKMHSLDLVQDNIARIRDLFPGCVTEAKGADGSAKFAVDFDQLRQELAESIVEGPQERYHLNWPGKREALLTANAPIAKTLRPSVKDSVDFDTTQNLYIEGDNLDALKLLQETYLGKVKMIYIDPPYNTGHDFLYEDDFAESTEEFLKKSNQKDGQSNRMIANTETDGRFHSAWLSMIFPRMKLARHLLRDDGVIFVSIDDNELANLRKICDEVFGSNNFIACITRTSKTTSFRGNFIAPGKDHVLCYAKDISQAKGFTDNVDESQYKKIESSGPRKGELYRDDIAFYLTTLETRPNQRYFIECPDGSKVIPPGKTFPPERPEDGDGVWRWSLDSYLEKKDLIVFKESSRSPLIDENGNQAKWNLYTKSYLLEKIEKGNLPRDIWSEYLNRSGSAELKKLNIPFDFPKPTGLIVYMMKIMQTKPGDIVLDFFSGSGTTADAVMQANAQDGGKRRFIVIQLPEVCDETSEAFKQGFTDVAQLGRERIRRAGQKIRCAEPSIDSIDFGFRALKVDTSNIAEFVCTPDALEKPNLDMFVDNIKPDRTPEDLLFQVMLDWGVDLALPIAKQTIQGKDVFLVDGNALAACFDGNGGVDEDFVKELAKVQPLRVVFRDAGFKDSSVKINVEQIFKLLSPATEVKCI